MQRQNSPITPSLYPFDWFIAGYCLVMAILLTLLGNAGTTNWYTVGFYCVSAGVPFLVVAVLRNRAGRLAEGVRLLYPVALFTFLYRATADTMFLLFDQFLDGNIVAFETGLFGIEPTVWMDSLLPMPLLTDFLSACYFSYYLMIPTFTIWVFVRKEYDILKRSLSAITLTFIFSYALFFLFPAEGPRWFQLSQYTHRVEGIVFRPLVELVISNGAVHGGAMPSSHTGVALIILIFSWWHYRRTAGWLTVIVCGLASGAVWGRFHYVSDILVGAAVAVVALFITERMHKRRHRLDSRAVASKDKAAAHVS